MLENKISTYLKDQPSKEVLEADQREFEETINEYASKWVGCPKPSAIAWSAKAIFDKRSFTGHDQIFPASSGNDYLYSIFINGMHIPDFLAVSFMVAGDLTVEEEQVSDNGVGLSLTKEQSVNNSPKL